MIQLLNAYVIANQLCPCILISPFFLCVCVNRSVYFIFIEFDFFDLDHLKSCSQKILKFEIKISQNFLLLINSTPNASQLQQ